MLYFSETGWTLPDIMQANSEFDLNYDQDEYERKINRLVRRIQKGNGDQRGWREAVRRLRSEDHYLLVLIDGDAQSPKSRHPAEVWKLVLTASAVVAVLLPAEWLLYSHVSDTQVAKPLSLFVFIVVVAGAMYLNQRASR